MPWLSHLLHDFHNSYEYLVHVQGENIRMLIKVVMHVPPPSPPKSHCQLTLKQLAYFEHVIRSILNTFLFGVSS